MEDRQRKRKTPQVKPEVNPDGPNQVWSWDLTYIAIGPIFVYLFAIIDVYSRKIVGWHLGFNARVESMKKAWDKALVNENLIGVSGAPKLPIALSDHGVQMAKKTAKQFFKDLGIKQLFARYQTPQDNAWIESWFRILKYDLNHVVGSSNDLKLVHLVAALLKRWLLGTYQGAVRPSHLMYYLDEFTFRFNRRKSASRGKLFYRLVQQAMMVEPAPLNSLKGPALKFLEGMDNLNLDPIDEDRDHNI